MKELKIELKLLRFSIIKANKAMNDFIESYDRCCEQLYKFERLIENKESPTD